MHGKDASEPRAVTFEEERVAFVGVLHHLIQSLQAKVFQGSLVAAASLLA